MTFEEDDEEEEDLSVPSVMHVTDCCAGHCGCYYTNCNRCCRCGEYQYNRQLIHRYIKYGDSRDGESPDRKPVLREESNSKVRWLD